MLILSVNCAVPKTRPSPPLFMGVETRWWLVQESGPIDRNDVLPAFEASARSYGCSTERLGADSSPSMFGERRTYVGVSASCEEGTIALMSLVGGRIRIGCAKPTTRQGCDLLLRNISEGR